MKRRKSMYSVADFCKGMLSITLFISAMAVQFKTVGDPTYGAKAAMLATGAATCLFIGLIPTWSKDIGGIVATYVNRFVGAIVTFLAGWNWLLSEVGGDIWPTFAPAIWMMASVTLGLFVGLLGALTRVDD